MSYNPWLDAARRYPEIHIEWADIGPVEGAVIPSERVILVNSRLDKAGRRCALAHELAHLDAGDIATDLSVVTVDQERRALALAAYRLVDYDDLEAALLWADTIPELAETLDVTPRVLRAAVDRMHPARRARLTRIIERRDQAA